MPLSGKKALVTGGKRNIGRGIALALAKAGCDIGINDLERDEDVDETLGLIRDMGRKASFYQADISSPDQVQTMVDAFLEESGRIDILVNNPFFTQSTPFLEVPEEAWDRTLDVCLKGYFLCSQRAARAMVSRGNGGCIVSISSVHAERVWLQDTCYGVAKAGILRLTQSMAVELAEHGIRCNAIMPGYMDTSHVFGTDPPQTGSIGEHLHLVVPSRRSGTPEDIGQAVAFLCSPAAGNITGVTLPVEGGLLATAGLP